METILMQIGKGLLSQTWQIGVLFVLVAMACWILRRRSAHWRYLLWLVILVKCLIPPVVTVPVAVLPERTPVVFNIPESQIPLPAGEEAPVFSPAVPPVAVEGGSIPSPSHKLTDYLPVMNLQSWLVLGWAVGAGCFLVAALWRAGRMHRRFRRLRWEGDEAVREQVEGLACQFKLRTAPAVWVIDGIAQPFVWGVFRGSIYLPANFSAGGTVADRQGILMHELAHVARFDALVNFLQVIAQGLFFFHPLVWWANSRIRQEREKCCDEVAIARLGGSPRQYGSAIVETLVREYEESRPLGSLAVAGSVKNIEDRVKTIMVPNKKFYSRPSRIVVISVLLLAAVAVPTALVVTTRAEKKTDWNIERPTSNAQHRTQEKAAENGTEFKAKLSNGATVELLGVGGDTRQGKQWWRPDGTLLTGQPYAVMGGWKGVYAETFNGNLRDLPKINQEFILRVSGPGTIAIARIGGCNLFREAYGLDFKGQAVRDLGAHFETRLKQTDISVKVAAGPWKTITTFNHRTTDFSSQNYKEGGVIFNPPYEKEGQAAIVVTDTVGDQDIRVIGRDDLDRVYTSTCAVRGGVGQHVMSGTFTFNVPLKIIKSFQFQFRPYEWMTFKNVSLEAGKTTDVKIEVEKTNTEHSSPYGDKPSNIQHRTQEKSVGRYWITDSSQLTTQPVGSWGKAAEKVETRLRVEKKYWQPRELITLYIDLRNQSDRPFRFFPAQENGILKVNDKLFNWSGQLSDSAVVLKPGEAYPNIPLKLTDGWHAKTGGEPLTLSPGREDYTDAFVPMAWAMGYILMFLGGLFTKYIRLV